MSLPVLDVTALRSAPSSAKAAALSITLREICHNQGFCYIIGHGLSGPSRALAAQAQQFFKLPLDARKSIAIENTPHFRGYTILGTEQTKGEADWRDQIDFADDMPAPVLGPNDPAWLALRGPNQWPTSQPALAPTVTSWMAGMHALGMDMISALAQGLGLAPDYFTPYFTPRGDARLKLIRYKVPGGKRKSGTGQGVGWHHDTGFLTFIWQDDIGGLQVDIDGQITNAAPMKNAFVMNLGEMLQVATGGYLRATPHRVISPPAGRERQSTAYFFNPSLETKFTPIPLPSALAAKARGSQNIDPNDPVFNVVGANILKTRLRAHPSVAEKFYTDKSVKK